MLDHVGDVLEDRALAPKVGVPQPDETRVDPRGINRVDSVDDDDSFARLPRARVAGHGMIEQPHRLLARGLHHLAVHVTKVRHARPHPSSHDPIAHDRIASVHHFVRPHQSGNAGTAGSSVFGEVSRSSRASRPDSSRTRSAHQSVRFAEPSAPRA